MANYTFSNLKQSYHAAWEGMVIHPDILPRAQIMADKIISYKDRYLTLEAQTGVPWYFIGLVHMRESNCDFNTHLHNGDPLNVDGKFKRTTHEPKARPVKRPENGLTYTFDESALDALNYEFPVKQDWGIEYIAYSQEKYNGFGYKARGLASPYLWAGSNQYSKGKFITDGKFDPAVVDSQLGVMVVLKCILQKESISAIEVAIVRESAAPILPIPMSPSADVEKPKSAELRKVSRKFWLNEWMQHFFGWITGGTAIAGTLDIANIQATRTYVDTLKSFTSNYGIFIVIFALLAGFVVTYQLKRWMKEDVAEGRNIPSGEAK